MMSIKEFKPGNKSYLEYDGTVLNANVLWNELVNELIEKNCSTQSIAEYAECDHDVIMNILAGDFSTLSFRAGARIVTLHAGAYPDCYF
jgi:hypothetical protein